MSQWKRQVSKRASGRVLVWEWAKHMYERTLFLACLVLPCLTFYSSRIVFLRTTVDPLIISRDENGRDAQISSVLCNRSFLKMIHVDHMGTNCARYIAARRNGDCGHRTWWPTPRWIRARDDSQHKTFARECQWRCIWKMNYALNPPHRAKWMYEYVYRFHQRLHQARICRRTRTFSRWHACTTPRETLHGASAAVMTHSAMGCSGWALLFIWLFYCFYLFAV